MTNIDLALNAGLEAFWDAVAKELPECKTGDFPPDAQMEFERVARSAIKYWHSLNVVTL